MLVEPLYPRPHWLSGGNADKELNAAPPLLKHLMWPNCLVCTLAMGVTASKRWTFIFKYSSRRGRHIYIRVSTSASTVPSYLSLRGAQEAVVWRSRPANSVTPPLRLCVDTWRVLKMEACLLLPPHTPCTFHTGTLCVHNVLVFAFPFRYKFRQVLIFKLIWKEQFLCGRDGLDCIATLLEPGGNVAVMRSLS